MKLSVGIGLTNACNLECPHCYRNGADISHITMQQVKQICEQLPVAAMGFGTGENALNPEFIPIVEYLHARGVQLSLASNGYSLAALSDDHLRAFHDVEVSIDFASRQGQDTFRGEGNWDLVHRAMQRCRSLGVRVSVLTTMMNVNYLEMEGLVQVARGQEATLRVNAYQCVRTDRYRLSYDQFWEGYRRLFAVSRVASCAEPVVRAAMGLGEVRSPCGHTSIRFNERGQLIPCVYWPVDGQGPTVADLPRLGMAVLESEEFQRARASTSIAARCRCQGGCASRRALRGQMDAHDEYCPWARGEEIRLEWRPAAGVELMRARNVCTTIVAPW